MILLANGGLCWRGRSCFHRPAQPWRSDTGRRFTKPSRPVMTGLVPVIHELRHKLCRFPWMPGTRPGTPIEVRLHDLDASEHSWCTSNIRNPCNSPSCPRKRSPRATRTSLGTLDPRLRGGDERPERGGLVCIVCTSTPSRPKCGDFTNRSRVVGTEREPARCTFRPTLTTMQLPQSHCILARCCWRAGSMVIEGAAGT